MKKYLEIGDNNSCLNQAEWDEPVFVLRAHDILAIPTVEYWIEESERLALHNSKLDEAKAWLHMAHEWRAKLRLNSISRKRESLET